MLTAGASAVTATPLPPSGITNYASNSTFVGDMAVDTQVPVTMTLRANASLKSGSYKIPVRINYLNNFRENLSTTIIVPVTIGTLTMNAIRVGTGTYSGRYAGGSGIFSLIAVIVVLVILAVVVFFAWKRGLLKRFSHKPKSK